MSRPLASIRCSTFIAETVQCGAMCVENFFVGHCGTLTGMGEERPYGLGEALESRYPNYGRFQRSRTSGKTESVELGENYIPLPATEERGIVSAWRPRGNSEFRAGYHPTPGDCTGAAA